MSRAAGALTYGLDHPEPERDDAPSHRVAIRLCRRSVSPKDCERCTQLMKRLRGLSSECAVSRAAR